MFALLLAVVLAQPADPGHACQRDGDCLISTTQCCPGCCGPSPYPTSKADEAVELQKCAVIECAGAPKCDVQCERPISKDAVEARCVAKQCVMRLKKPTKAR